MKEVYDEIVDFMFENDMLSENAVIVKECDVHFQEDERFSKYRKYKIKWNKSHITNQHQKVHSQFM